MFNPNNPPSNPDRLYSLEMEPKDSAVLILPVPFDATASYGMGARHAPEAIIKASQQMDLYDVTLGEPWKYGITMLPVLKEIPRLNDDATAFAAICRENPSEKEIYKRLDEIGESVNVCVEAATKAWLQENKILGVLGGDHSVSFGAIKAAAEMYENLSVLHIDAHADMREAYEGFTWSHASVMYNVLTKTEVARVVQVGVRDLCPAEYTLIRSGKFRIEPYFYESDPVEEAIELWIPDSLTDKVWISCDIDGFDPSLCPNTGCPVPGGLTFMQFNRLLTKVVGHGKRVVGFDLVEVAPARDNEWDANVGARVLYKLAGYALRSQGFRG